MSEAPGECSKPITEPCRLHPVDCPHCKNEPTCKLKEIYQGHKDKIKRCRFYEPSGKYF